MSNRTVDFVKSATAGLALLLAAYGVLAAPVADLSRTSVAFPRGGPNIDFGVQPVFVTNIGDAPLVISGAVLGGSNPSDFRVAGTCTPAVTLAPNGRCRLDFTATYTAGTTRSATLTLQTNASPPPANITLSGLNDGVPDAFPPDPSPDFLDFSAQPVGTTAASQVLAIQNPGTFVFTLTNALILGDDAGDFSLAFDCPAGSKLPPGGTCNATVGFTPSANGPRSAELLLSLSAFGIAGSLRISLTGIGGAAGPAGTSTVVEFYNAALDHYFITWVPAEIALLDAGTTIKGWTRTGQQFRTYTAPQAGTTDICRIYIIPERGNSHFFGRGTKECNDTMAAHPDFILEEPKFMALLLPVLGVCPAGTTNIYRVFSNRADANHRYMTDKAIRDQMVAKNWTPEGDGPDLVVMCAP